MITAELGEYGRATLAQGPTLATPNRLQPKPAEWVRDNWDRIMGLNAKGEAGLTSDWHEFDGLFTKAASLHLPFGRRSAKI